MLDFPLVFLCAQFAYEGACPTVQVSNTFDFMFDIISARTLADGSVAVLKRVLPTSEEEAARTAKHTGSRR